MTTTFRTAQSPSDAMLVLTNQNVEPVCFTATPRPSAPAPETSNVVRLAPRTRPAFS